MNRRASGLLFHLTSLPSPYGIGDLGPEAYKFADFLRRTRQTYWQVLPLNPTDTVYGDSPYHSSSAFAFNTLLISPDFLVTEGWLDAKDLRPVPEFPPEKVDYAGVTAYKNKLYLKLRSRLREGEGGSDFIRFCAENAFWLEDFALFSALRKHLPKRIWSEWPAGLRDREPASLEEARKEFRRQVLEEKYLQFIFFRQWGALREYCLRNNIYFIGDIPIYVDYDSADVWSHPHLFMLDSSKKQEASAGVPPDYFSATGQLWGNPIYRWEELKRRGYQWWVERIGQNLKLFEFVRIDHFRGFVAYWEVPVGKRSALDGYWVEAPAVDFFNTLGRTFPHLPLIAEDLGTITPDVRKAMKQFGFPGMKVLLFAFDEDNPAHPYLPHMYEQNFVVYTGTHDNNTTRGWFENEAGSEVKARLFRYLGREVSSLEVPWDLIRLAMMSVANTAIYPVQDILRLGGEARMNYPSAEKGNWRWRLLPGQLTPEIERRLAEMTVAYGRA